MPKVKTNSGAKKRFTFTGTGKVKRHHAYHSHILTKKTKKQKRNLDHSFNSLPFWVYKSVLPSVLQQWPSSRRMWGLPPVAATATAGLWR